VKLETAEVESAGDLAFETGIVHLVAKDGLERSARYRGVGKRADGMWLLHRDIWNTL
jgi:ketosteroid isomerase-like protein